MVKIGYDDFVKYIPCLTKQLNVKFFESRSPCGQTQSMRVCEMEY